MTGVESVVGLVLSVLVDGVPRVRAALPGETLMSRRGVAPAARADRAARDQHAAARHLHGEGVRRRSKAPGDRVFRPIERAIYRVCGVDPETRAALDDVRALAAGVQLRVGRGPVRAAPAPGPPAAQPRQPAGRHARAVVQHGGQLPHQHELAELLGRVDDVAPHPDGRPRGPQLRVGRGRRGRRGRADPRTRPAAHAHARQLLGRPRRGRRRACCCRSRSCSRSCS